MKTVDNRAPGILKVEKCNDVACNHIHNMPQEPLQAPYFCFKAMNENSNNWAKGAV